MIVAKCAAPDRPQVLPPLIRLGLPVHWRDSTATAAFAIDVRGRAPADDWSRRSPIRGRRRRCGRSEADAGCTSPRCRAATFRPRPSPRSPAAAALSLDGQGLVRPARTGPLELDADYDPELLRFVSILKLADDEAAMLVDGYDERALGRLGVPEIVVTLGSRGCIVFARRDRRARPLAARSRRATRPAPATRSRPPTSPPAAAGAAPTAAARRAAALVADLLAGRAA